MKSTTPRAHGSGRDQTEAFPHGGRLRQHARPAAVALVLTRLDRAARIGIFRRIGRERIGRELIDARTTRTNRDGRVLPGAQRHMLELHLAALAWMGPIEIERERVE